MSVLILAIDGRPRRAWDKLGIALRLAHNLRLVLEPPKDLDPASQYERRQLFWSIYILAKSMSCDRSNPSMIADEVCHVQLPVRDLDILSPRPPELRDLWNDQISHHAGLSPFGLLVLAMAVLGRCAVYVHQLPDNRTQTHAWSTRSEYSALESMLLSLELMSTSNEPPKHQTSTTAGDTQRESTSNIDRIQCTLTQLICMLCHCLINHPFLSIARRQLPDRDTPVTFLRRTFRICHESATSMVHLLRSVDTTECESFAPVLGYCLVIAGTIQALLRYSVGEYIEGNPAVLLSETVELLERLSVSCSTAGFMVEVIPPILR